MIPYKMTLNPPITFTWITHTQLAIYHPHPEIFNAIVRKLAVAQDALRYQLTKEAIPLAFGCCVDISSNTVTYTGPYLKCLLLWLVNRSNFLTASELRGVLAQSRPGDPECPDMLSRDAVAVSLEFTWLHEHSLQLFHPNAEALKYVVQLLEVIQADLHEALAPDSPAYQTVPVKQIQYHPNAVTYEGQHSQLECLLQGLAARHLLSQSQLEGVLTRAPEIASLAESSDVDSSDLESSGSEDKKVSSEIPDSVSNAATLSELSFLNKQKSKPVEPNITTTDSANTVLADSK
ncbi:MAG: hypothetical protein A3J38_03210 [Gammaproteobacteria bacterium RIFCSPHIGHO2_12_FULL_45_9]|nr:MAG: hypothetical protein A3J38_03210 [Gammaproteobacteria bacterium RIFCSPHIGHO2_12_FULL_45_9]